MPPELACATRPLPPLAFAPQLSLMSARASRDPDAIARAPSFVLPLVCSPCTLARPTNPPCAIASTPSLPLALADPKPSTAVRARMPPYAEALMPSSTLPEAPSMPLTVVRATPALWAIA